MTTTQILGQIVPTSTLDTYATHSEEYGKGGYRSVATAAERDAIPADRLKLGMEVRVMDEDKVYYLSAMNPNTWSVVKTFDKKEDLGLDEEDVIVTAGSFAQEFKLQLNSSDYKDNFNTNFKTLYKDEIHLGSYVDETTFKDSDDSELFLTNNHLYVDTATQIIYVCQSNKLKEIGSVATWNDVKGGSQVKFGAGLPSGYKKDEDTIYFAMNQDLTEGDIYYNGINFTEVKTDNRIDATTAGSLNPVQTSAVYKALSDLKQEFSGGIIEKISHDVQNEVLSTTLTMKDGSQIFSAVSLNSSSDSTRPVVDLSGSSQIYVKDQSEEANLVFNFNFFNNALERYPVPAAQYTAKLSIEYYSENSSVNQQLDVTGILLVAGRNSININNLLGSTVLDQATTYYFTVNVEVEYQGETYTPSRALTYTYTIIDLLLQVLSLGDGSLMEAFGQTTEVTNITFSILGSTSIKESVVVQTYLDGVPNNNVVGGSSVPVTGLTPGEHTIQVVAYYSAGSNNTIYSNLEYYKIYVGTVETPVINVYIPIPGGNSNPMVPGIPELNVQQFCQYQIKYYALYPESIADKSNVVFTSKAGSVETACGEYAVTTGVTSIFTYRYLEQGLKECTVACGNSSFRYNVQVDPSSLGLTNSPAGLKLYLDGSGKSNNSNFRDTWEYNTVTSKFKGFTWGANDGWMTASDGQTFLRVVNSASVDIDYRPLSSANFNTNHAMTFSTKIKVSNVSDENETIISFLDADGKGLYITPSAVSFASTGALPSEDQVGAEDFADTSSIKAVLNQNEEHTITVVVYPHQVTASSLEEHQGVVYLFVDGIVSGMSQINIAANTLVQNDPANIKLSAKGCQLDVYSMRCYNIYKSFDDVLNMYLVDSGSYDLMVEKHSFNNIIAEGMPKPGANGVPYMIINGQHADSDGNIGPAVANLANKDNDKWGIQSIQFVDPLNQARNFYCVSTLPVGEISDSTKLGPAIQIQGTSSSVYPRKNLKIKLKAGWTYLNVPFDAMHQTNVDYRAKITNEEGEEVANPNYKKLSETYSAASGSKYQLSDNSTGETTFTIKVDYAESSGSHNAGTANLVHRIMTDAGDLIPPQKMLKDKTSSHTADIRTTCEGHPIMLYYRENEDKRLIYGGKANLLNDKSDESVFGFTKIENYTYKFDNGDPDFMETDSYVPLRVITREDLAGTVNVVYQESFSTRADKTIQVEKKDELGEVVKDPETGLPVMEDAVIKVLSGKTPFASWNAFTTMLYALSEEDLKTWVDIIIGEATLTLANIGDAKCYAFANDTHNLLVTITKVDITGTVQEEVDGVLQDVEKVVDYKYTLANAKANPIQCWEFRTNSNLLGAFLSTDFRELGQNGAPMWFNNVWESRFPDDKTANNVEYAAGRIPYSLYTLAKWIGGTNRKEVGLTQEQINSRTLDFKQNLDKYFNVNVLCDYYTITDVIAAADQRVKNMMWAFYYDPTLDTPTDVMHGLRCYPIFYDNDTILGVNNSGVIYDPLTGTLTIPWDADHDTTCACTGYPGLIAGVTDDKQFSFSGHDSVIWVNVRELMQDELKQAYLRMNDDKLTNKLNRETVSKIYNDEFTSKYAECVFNQDAVYKYVSPKKPSHYSKAQGSRKAHRKWFLDNRFSLFNAKYDLYDNDFLQGKGGSAQGHAVISLTMDHDWYCTMMDNDTHYRYQFSAAKDQKVSMDWKLTTGKTADVGASFVVFGLSRAKELDIDWDSTTELNFDESITTLPRLLKYKQTSNVVSSEGMPNLSICPNLLEIELNNVKLTGTFNVTSLIKLRSLVVNGGTGSTLISLPEGGLLEELHLPGIPNTQLRFVNLPLLTNSGISFDSEDGWKNVSSLIVKDCPNLDTIALFNKVSPYISRIYIEGVEMEGNGNDLKDLMARGVKGYEDNLTTPINNCTISGTYNLTTLLPDNEFKELERNFPYLKINNLEYSLYKFTNGTGNTSNVVYVTNMETGISGSSAQYAPTGHVKTILDQRHGYAVKMSTTDPGTFYASQLSDINHLMFIDGSDSSEAIQGIDGVSDWMIFEPHYWYKGINDFRNSCMYAAYASSQPSVRNYLVINDENDNFAVVSDPSLFGSVSSKAVGYRVTAAVSNTTLKTDVDNDYSVLYYVLPENHKFKQFRVTSTVATNNRGAVVIDKDKRVLANLTALANTGMYEGAYVFANLPENAYAIVFTVLTTIQAQVLLTTSSNLADIEPEWVEHKACFVGRTYSVPVNGEIRSILYNTSTIHSTEGVGKTAVDLQTMIQGRGAGYFTTFDYEQFKDTINLAFIKYGTTNLGGLVGTGLTTNGAASGAYTQVFDNSKYGMMDSSTYGDGSSYFEDSVSGSAIPTNTPIIMGYERLTGTGNSVSANDHIVCTANSYVVECARTGRSVAVVPRINNTVKDSLTSNPEAALPYIYGGKYLDIFSNGNVSVHQPNVGYGGNVNYGYNTSNSSKQGYLKIGRSQQSGTLLTDLIFLDARALTSYPAMGAVAQSRGSLTNVVRLMITPKDINIVSATEYKSL